jgi:hypothetical protein
MLLLTTRIAKQAINFLRGKKQVTSVEEKALEMSGKPLCLHVPGSNVI